jgi:hypothetical protein
VTHSTEPDEDLLCLLRGELGRQQTRELADHLRGCEPCRLALVDVAEVHGTLVSAGRLLRHLSDESLDPLTAGSAAAPGLSDGWTDPGEQDDDSGLPPLNMPRRRRTIPGRLVAGIAAAVVVAAGLGVGSLVLKNRDESPAGRTVPPVAAARTVVLQPVTGAAAGRVSMQAPGAQTEMTISTAGLPEAGAGRFYYAWLLDPTTQKMLPLGVVSAKSPMHFEVPTGLVGRYHAVDISLQSDNGNPSHSATSVLRAQY